MGTSPDLQKKKVDQFLVIPAIDIIGGKCVRLSQGDYSQSKVYNESPLEVAKMFEDAGLKRLHLVDLDGAQVGAVKNWKVLEQIAGNTSMVIDFGGGLKTVADIEIVFNSGAALATIGSLAVKEPELFRMILQQYGAAKFFVGADVKDELIAVSGWTEQTEINITDFIHQYRAAGVSNFFCTDIAKDGMMEGPSIDLYKKIIADAKEEKHTGGRRWPACNLTASGGVSSIEDVYRLREIGCAGVIIGKAIYEGLVTLKQLRAMNFSN